MIDINLIPTDIANKLKTYHNTYELENKVVHCLHPAVSHFFRVHRSGIVGGKCYKDAYTQQHFEAKEAHHVLNHLYVNINIYPKSLNHALNMLSYIAMYKEGTNSYN